MQDFIHSLREHNLKATPQRLAISAALYQNGHMSIDALYEELIRKFDSLSLATIYKNIHIMIENSFIQEVKIPHAKSVYELTKESHSHLVCNSCGLIEDIAVDLAPYFKQHPLKTTFKIEKSELVFSGFCSHCQNS